ncbi:TPA: hypothetical protein NG581_004539 [Vibrio parahaemolyticus]|nr:hypothetical protein [Vibrio parahaemolyticus]
MESLIINFQSIEASNSQKKDLEEMLSELLGDEGVTLSSSNSFNGVEDVVLILSIGGGVIFTELAKVIAAWIKKDDNKKVKYKNIEISGYSSDEVLKFIKENDGEK